MKTKKEKTSKQVSQPKALTSEQNKAAVEHALKLKAEKEQKELEEIKKLHLTGHQAQELLKAIKADEVKKEKATQPKPETKKAPKAETMAEYLDRLIAKGGTWESLVKEAQAEAEKKGSKTKLSRGTLQGHISYRVKKEADWLKERNLTVADEGIAVKK